MDSFQSRFPNDQRPFSMELAIGVNPAELNALSPDAAPQPTPVNQTTLVPSAKTFDLLGQLEALAHQVALVNRGDSSDQRIKVQEVSNFSIGLEPVEPSIRVSPRDQVSSDSPSFGRRTNLSPVGFFTAARDRLASYRPSFGIATLANSFIAARDLLASYRPSFGRPSAALPGFFVAVRDWLASRRPPFGSRTSASLASFFIAALVGVAAAFVWQSQRVSTAKSPNDVAVSEKQSGFTPVGQLSLQDAPPQIASATKTAPTSTAPATSSELVQQLEDTARDLVVLRRRVEELAAQQEHLVDAQEQLAGKQEHLVDAQEELAARQEQMAQTIAKPQAVKQNTNNKMSSPPRRNGSSKPAAQASSLPRPRPPLSPPPDRR
jgi:hypothetical protein